MKELMRKYIHERWQAGGRAISVCARFRWEERMDLVEDVRYFCY